MASQTIDDDPLANILQPVPTSRFGSIQSPNWPDAVYDEKYQHSQVLGGGIQYTMVWLQSDVIRQVLDPGTNNYVANWNPDLSGCKHEFEEITAGNKSRLASFHAGANWILGKLRAEMPTAVAQRGLAECLDTMEAGLHKQFISRIAGFWTPVEGQATHTVKILSVTELVKFVMGAMSRNNGTTHEEHGTSAAEDNTAIEEEADATSESGDEKEVAVPEEQKTRRRNRTKSKKAKKAAKKAKAAKAA